MNYTLVTNEDQLQLKNVDTHFLISVPNNPHLYRFESCIILFQESVLSLKHLRIERNENKSKHLYEPKESHTGYPTPFPSVAECIGCSETYKLNQIKVLLKTSMLINLIQLIYP